MIVHTIMNSHAVTHTSMKVYLHWSMGVGTMNRFNRFEWKQEDFVFRQVNTCLTVAILVWIVSKDLSVVSCMRTSNDSVEVNIEL